MTVVVAFVLFLAAPAGAQCVGDCNADATVAINELILGVNIALGTSAVSVCPSFDANHDGMVAINELIAAVANALNACPAGSTPTATIPLGTATPTVGATETPTPPEGCGNGTIDVERGETCDDGNTSDGDNCPSTCRIRSCVPAGTTIDVNAIIPPPQPDLIFGALTVLLRYPDGVVSLPGAGTDPLGRFTLPPSFISQVNDLNYAARVVSVDPGGIFLGESPPNLFFTATFDRCEGEAAPSASDFICTVENAGDIDRNDVTASTACSISLP